MRALVTHCINGHELTPDNVYLRKNGYRHCRTCALAQAARRYVPHPRPEPNMPTEPIVLAYAAGIFDGEGSVSIPTNRKRPGEQALWHALVVRVTSTDPRLPDWLQDHFGGTVRISHKGKERQSPASNWARHARGAEAFLRAIRPFLVIKADQADVAFAFRESLLGPGKRGMTPELYAYRETLRAELRRLQTYRRLSPIGGSE